MRRRSLSVPIRPLLAGRVKLRAWSRGLPDALEQQAATSEVLQVISGSAGDLQPVFAAMLENAVRICDATFGIIYRWDGEFLHSLASHKTPTALAEARRRSPIRPRPDMVRTVTTKSVVHIPDLAAHVAYIKDRDPALVSAVELGGVRTFRSFPCSRGLNLSVHSLYRQEVRPFTDKQIALVTRLRRPSRYCHRERAPVNELRQRTTDLYARAGSANGQVKKSSKSSLACPQATLSQFSPRDAGERRARLRSQHGRYLPLGWRGHVPCCYA